MKQNVSDNRLIVSVLLLLILAVTPKSANGTSALLATNTPLPALQVLAPNNARNIQQVAQFGHGWSSTLMWSPGGHLLISTGDNGRRLYDVEHPETPPLDLPEQTTNFAFSPNDRLLATGTYNNIHLWQMPNQKLLATLGGYSSTKLAFSQDSTLLASVDAYSNIVLWDVKRDERISVFSDPDYGNTRQLAFHNGKLLAVTVDSSGTLQLWNVTDGESLLLAQNASSAIIAFSPDGTQLASANQTLINLWDTSNSQKSNIRLNNTGKVSDIAYSSDSKWLASVGNDGQLRVWDSVKKQLVRTLNVGQNGCYIIRCGVDISRLAFGPDGVQVALLDGYDAIQLWNWYTGYQTGIIGASEDNPSNIANVAFSPDSAWLAYAGADNTVQLRDLTQFQNRVISSTTDHNIIPITFSHDSKSLLTLGENQIARSWDLQTGQSTGLASGIPYKYKASVISASGGQWLAVVANRNILHIWDLQTRQPVAKIVNPAIGNYDAVLSPDGNWLASVNFIRNDPSTFDNELRLWDVRRQQSTVLLNSLSTEIPLTMIFSADSTLFAATATPDAANGDAIGIWDVQTAQLRLKLSANTGSPWGLAFNPANNLLALAGSDSKLRIWDLQNNLLKATLTGPTAFLVGIAFSPDGKMIVTASGDDTIRLWGVPETNIR
jgi:WD40 repeat protein